MALTLLFVALLGPVACDSGGDDEAADTSAPSSTVATSSTLATTTSVPFDIEVKQAAIDLLEIRNDVFQHPDVARVSEYIADTCTCLDRERALVQRFVDEGLHWTDRIVQPRGIHVSAPDAVSPEVAVVALEPTADLVDEGGAVHQHLDAFEDATYSVTLLRQPDGQWRINGLEGIELNAENIAAIVGEGLP